LLPPLEEKSIKSGSQSPLLDNHSNSQNSFIELQVEQQPKKTKKNLDLKLVVFMTQTLINCGVKSESIGVITPLNFERNYVSTKLAVRKCLMIVNSLET